ncbi:MAG: DNA repair protein RadC [Clostridiales bacterium]|jgi:DNA repair protein RadC|nr:DNA repair protein RadC [Clostridiales bacterium]
MGAEKDNPHENHRDRVRKNILLNPNALDSMQEHQILEFLLFYSVPRRDTNELAHRMIEAYGGLRNLMDAHPLDIMKKCGVGESSALLVSVIPKLARRYFRSAFGNRAILDSSSKTGNFAVSLLSGRVNECFFCVCLDVKRRFISSTMIVDGGISQADLYMRDVVECVIRFNASFVVLAHNHPSSDTKPSKSDLVTTCEIKALLEKIDIDIADHIIVGGNGYYSFAEHGLLGLSADAAMKRV